MRGVAKNTRLLLTSGKEADPFLETDEDIVDRVMRDLSSRGKGEIVVLNDEAHHCYQDLPLGSDKPDKEAKDRNEEPGSGSEAWRLWPSESE